MFFLPFLGGKTVPFGVKAGLAFFLALIEWNILQTVTMPVSVLQLLGFAIEQIMIGLCVGFMISCIFTAVQAAGEIIGMQIGFSIVNVFDPENQQPESIISRYFYISAVMIFFAIGGHHFLVRTIHESFTSVPLGRFVLSGNLFPILLNETTIMLTTAVKLSAPVLMTILISNVGMGIVAKTVPQINVFIVGMPLNIGIGLMTLYVTMSVFLTVFSSHIDGVFSRVLKMLPFLGG